MRVNFLFKNKLIFLITLVILSGFLVFLSDGVYAKVQQPWIKATAQGFIKNGKPFRFIGANAVNMIFYDDWNLNIEKAIRSAKENNITVLRFYMDWGWSKDEDFDKIIDVASQYGIYVILTLTDCCCSGGYSSFNEYLQVHAPFCNINNKQAIEAFKKRIKKIIGRRNSVNGKIYRDDPTILAWEIANELEYRHFNYADLQGWISEIATYIKSLDKNHLITISISTDAREFDTDNRPYEIFNVGALDFFSFHFYPAFKTSDSRKVIPDTNYTHQIEYRTKKFLSMNKPVIMGEFGFSNSADLNYKIKTSQTTKELYNSVFEKSMDSAFLAGVSGVMFWGWGVPEEKDIPMWWRRGSHSTDDHDFCIMIKGYRIPILKDAQPESS